MANPQPLRNRRTPRLALVAAAALLLALALLSVALPPRPAEAVIQRHFPPDLTVDKSSVVVNEGQTATNGGSFDDELDSDHDTVRISASVGTVTQSNKYAGTWSWSYATTNVSDDQTTQVTITAKDSTGRSNSQVFSLKVLDLDPYPVNDMFANATPIDVSTNGTRLGNTRLATMEAGENQLTYNPPGQDCGIYGRYNSVWFKVTIPSNYWAGRYGGLYFDSGGSNFDTVLALYKGTSLGTLQQVACSNSNPNSSSGDWTDLLFFNRYGLSEGSTYYLQLTGTGGARSGKYNVSWGEGPT